MVNNLFIFALSLVMVVKGATLSTRYAARLAECYRLSKYTIGFIIVAVISILPETFISINAALEGIPSFGLGMLFGSNVADLTLVFAIIIFTTGRNLKVESKVLKNHNVYPLILFLPLVLGFNGHYSRMEGLALILAGGIFYYLALKNGVESVASVRPPGNRLKNGSMLVFGVATLLLGSYFTVTSAASLALNFGVSPILIGMLVVGLGTIMPELFFALKAAQKNDDSLAVGDVLGTVLADATIVVGILALVNPFFFPKKIIYITGLFMVVAAFALFDFMRSGRTLTKQEAWMLLAFWAGFVLVELAANS
jgi:cation:H+ antiporter